MPVDERNLVRLMSQNESIRNVCILAHIDHGKTSLSDTLLASNGIIPPSMQGQIRYLDSRADEQMRGITMESSAISLYFRMATAPKSENEKPETSEYLINLIDSPGHIDFSSEVTTTSRLCDGAIVLVDAVEGVCSQSVAALKQAWDEKLKAILVINKIDRLYLEMQMSSSDAAAHLKKLIEQVNAVIGQLYNGTRMEQDDKDQPELSDDDLYFDPALNNVVFCSAIDGWGFTVSQFAAMYEKKLGVSREKLQKFLWGDFYLDPKTKKVSTGVKVGKKTLFVQFIMDSIWAVYNAVQTNDDAKLEKIGKSLGVATQGGLKPIFHQWIPVSRSVLISVVTILPSAAKAQSYRTELILSNSPRSDLIPTPVRDAMVNSDPNGEPVVYISKVVQVPKSDLKSATSALDRISELRLRSERVRREARTLENDSESAEVGVEEPHVEEVILGYARVYSGTIKVGDKLDLVAPKYDPSQADADSLYRKSVTISGLYLLMGRDLVPVGKAFPGNIVGIAGLDGAIVKSGTLVSPQVTHGAPNLARAAQVLAPILRVAVEPVDPRKLPELEKGLELLNVSDPSVEVSLSDKGEWILATSGELHFERCFKDLQDRFARVELECSEPDVPFKETIVAEPAQDASEDPHLAVSMEFGGLKVSVKVERLPEPIIEVLETKQEQDHDELRKVMSHCDYTFDQVVALAPGKSPTNMLIDGTGGEIGIRLNGNTARRQWDRSIVNGFSAAMLNGPLAGEPVHGVLAIITSLEYDGPSPPSGLLHRRLISATRELLYKAIRKWSPRLMLAMYQSDIQASLEVLGKVYGVITRRKGKIVSEELKEGTPFFLVTATVPIIESFGFSAEIRKRTSGSAHPQLVFSGYEVLDEDPYWVPTTEEELEELGDTADKENVALAYVNALRKRKGLAVNEKIVESAEQKRSFRH